MLRTKAMGALASAFILVVVLLLCGPLGAQPFSRILSFQGGLCDKLGMPLPTGDYELTFRIYNAESDGQLLWYETQTVTQSGGTFTVFLGADPQNPFADDLFEHGDLWLEVEYAGELMPRIRLTPSPWAMYAANSDKVDGFHVSQTPLPNYILPLDGEGMFPLSVIPQGPGSGLDADTLDTYHASDFWLKVEGGPFVDLAPLAPQTGAAVQLTGGGVLPTVTLRNDGLALRVISTAGEFGCDWQEMSPAAAPSARQAHAMAYDAQSDQIILFGGLGPSGPLGDTWAYDCGTNT
jgi:hypothetical protein